MIPPELKLPAPSPRTHWRNLLALWPAALLIGATAARAIAEDAPSRRDQLMADYVLNFTKFVEWPASARSQELVICVAGNTGLYNALRAGAATASVSSRHLAIRKIDEAHSVVGCHVLYVEPPGSLQIAQLENAAPMLTVSDGSGFTHAGGTIEFFTQRNKLRFIVNLQNAHRAGLRISSNLLQLAASVEGGEPK